MATSPQRCPRICPFGDRQFKISPVTPLLLREYSESSRRLNPDPVLAFEYFETYRVFVVLPFPDHPQTFGKLCLRPSDEEVTLFRTNERSATPIRRLGHACVLANGEPIY